MAGAPLDELSGAGLEHIEDFLNFCAGYFSGETSGFAGALDLDDASPTQQRLWRRVQQIPYGTTESYASIGRSLGLHPRVVGAGMRAVPVLLAIPAHRVIHADGRVGGFAGMEGVKVWLLDFEKANRQSDI